MDWSYIQSHFDWLGHIVEALVMTAVVTALLWWRTGARTAFLMGLAFAVGHFHGREKRDYEVSVHMAPPHLEAYYVWRWGWDMATDFWPVLLTMGGIAFVVASHKRLAPAHPTKRSPR